MPLLALPNELLLQIGSHLEHPDLNKLSRTSRYAAQVFGSELYRREARRIPEQSFPDRRAFYYIIISTLSPALSLTLVKRFLSCGANPDDFLVLCYPCNEWRKFPRSTTDTRPIWKRRAALEVIEELLLAGGDPNTVYVLSRTSILDWDNRWTSLLVHIVKNGPRGLLALFEGPRGEELDIELGDKQGHRPLSEAMLSTNELAVELLLERGADIYKRDAAYRSTVSPFTLMKTGSLPYGIEKMVKMRHRELQREAKEKKG